MPRTTEFSHTTLGKLLKDRKLEVPRFQRSYSWTETHYSEYWEDIKKALDGSESHFFGTIVLASLERENRNEADAGAGSRPVDSIVDGQQRIITTALLFVAIYRYLKGIGKGEAASTIKADYLAAFDLAQERVEPRLSLSKEDRRVYERLVEGATIDQLASERLDSPIVNAFAYLESEVKELAEGDAPYVRIVRLSEFLASGCHVLMAIATGLSEAYVIFETLNDRGAALTTADLLKNFLFSKAGERRIDDADRYWAEISSGFDAPDKLVDFIRMDYTSRRGVTSRKDLYASVQELVGGSGTAITTYLENLKNTQVHYEALRSPDHEFWAGGKVDVRDSLLAHRRFQIVAPFPVYLAALRKWKKNDAMRLIKSGAGWSIRASILGRLGGGTAEKIFGRVAERITSGELQTVDAVRQAMEEIIPSDSEFKSALVNVATNNARMKFILAMIERAYWSSSNRRGADTFPQWDSSAITVEHILPASDHLPASVPDSDFLNDNRNKLANLMLLEKRINKRLENRPAVEKLSAYKESVFPLTNWVGDMGDYGKLEMEKRLNRLLKYAVQAFPV